MRVLAVLTLASLSLMAAGPGYSQTPDLDEALRRARATTPLPLSLERDQAEWRSSHAELTDGVERAEDILSRTEAVLAQADRDAGLGRTVFRTALTLGRDCVASSLDGCSSSMGGYLALADGHLQWQIQDGFTEENGVSGGIVFIGDFGAAARGPVAPVAWSFDAARYDAPVLLEADGATYVAVPGVHAGSGAGNADLLFRWTPHASPELQQIDTWSWREALADRLPEGLEVWQGVRFDWPNMMAVTPLWQAGDGHCCGTGGSAILSFGIEGDKLVLSDVSVHDPLLDHAMATPTAVFDYIGRWAGCGHWGGEEGYDAERRAQIASALAELRCAALTADGAALRREYSDNPRTLALIARAEPESE